MKKLFKYFMSFLTAAVMVASFAACNDGSIPGGSDEPAVPDEPFGITQRPNNDLEDYADLRPDRKPFVDTAQPDDGELTDHIFEFEEMNSAGASRDKDHLCNAKSFVVSPDFSGNIALENIDAGVSFTLTIESDKNVRVPMLIGMNNMGNTLGEVLAITNNGHAVADTSAVVPSESHPALGAPGGYFNMVEVESAISLVKGTNRIMFKLTSAGVNYDYVNLRTSANLVNHTEAAWPVPELEIVAEPGEKNAGTVRLHCSHESCSDTADRYLPNIKNECYTVTDIDELTKEYSVTIMGQSFKVATTKQSQTYPEDTGELKDNFFEFENAMITGGSQDVESHFCATNSIMGGGGFGGNICVENLRQNTLTFIIESDETLCVPFVVRLSGDAGAPLENYLTIKNVTDNSFADVSGVFSSETEYPECSADVYFPMRKAEGKINLVQGENVIEITRRNGNLDYINIRTSANLTDKTQSYWNAEHLPEFRVDVAPTATSRGRISIMCPTDGCTKETKTVDLPTLANECYILEDDVYYLMLLGQKIKICDAS